MRAVSKKIITTVNSNGNSRTIINITNQRNNEILRTQAISNKKDPKKYEVMQQKIERVGDKVIAKEKTFHMKEKNIIDLFHSAEEMHKNFDEKETKSPKRKSTMKKTKKTSSTKRIKVKSHSKKMKGGSDVIGFDPHRFGDMAPFQTLEQERQQTTQKGGIHPIISNAEKASMMNAVKTAIDSTTTAKVGGKMNRNRK